ncbi:hypothetical protein Tel_08345 [Candidatus Tenderia electrophaga]|jgi:fructokinase|uniref:Carbohydrate kinase PfkB domain-containing protein n=1 Tax=Candidatus Tenderia electrophaga TaxID=1748243 RepID=A0A0S2TDC6_9GAMM|nr:hypothetical protein Tel_08345 [Candidatus Tenderia electrophaga]
MAQADSAGRLKPVIFGEVLFDCFSDGQTVLGGAPFNVAWHLQALGDAPCFISRVGDDSHGANIIQAMAQWGMDVSGLQRDDSHPTGQVIVTIEDGEPHYDIKRDVAYDFIQAAAFPAIDQPALLYHGTLALRNPVSRQALDALLQRGDFSIFLDVNLRPPWWDGSRVHEYLQRARWAKLNEHELALLTDEQADAEARAQGLRRRCGLELLLVTHGSKGAVAYAEEGAVARVAPAAATQVVDTVGAGDAFTAVLLHGLLNDWPLQRTLDTAQNFASAVVGIRGAVPSDVRFYRDNLPGLG